MKHFRHSLKCQSRDTSYNRTHTDYLMKHYIPFFLVNVHANRTQMMLSGGPGSSTGALDVLDRNQPSTASLPFWSPSLALSLLTGGGGRIGRLFLLSGFEPASTWNSPPVPSALIVNVRGVPVTTAVPADGVAVADGESDTAAKNFLPQTCLAWLVFGPF